jgi:hypothetical protein
MPRGKAKDGQPADELSERRARGTSAADRAENGDAEPTGDELFPLGTIEGDPRVTVRSLIKAGARVSVTASLSSAEVPVSGGLFDPEQEISVLVRCIPGKVEQVPKHEDKDGIQKVKEWTVRQSLRSIHVERADAVYSESQVREMLAECDASPAKVSRLLGEKQAVQG